MKELWPKSGKKYPRGALEVELPDWLLNTGVMLTVTFTKLHHHFDPNKITFAFTFIFTFTFMKLRHHFDPNKFTFAFTFIFTFTFT